MWHKQLVYYCFLLLLPLLVCMGCVSKATYEALQKENEVLRTEIQLYKDTFGEIYQNVQPPYEGAHSMELHNNPDANNPTWDELVAFLKKDETEKIRYWDDICTPKTGCRTLADIEELKKKLDIPENETPDNFVCADFANLLHDNAELNGIKTAVVVIDTTRESYPHVVNAFITTDRGLVFIDDTGTEDCSGVDKVAYVKLGDNMGSIKVYDNIPLDYEWFASQLNLWNEYNKSIEGYNFLYKLHGYESDYMKNLREKSDEMGENLIPIFLGGNLKSILGAGLGEIINDVVTNVEIYW